VTAAALMRRPGRNPRLAKIHIARKELRLDDDAYRAILLRLTGHQYVDKGEVNAVGLHSLIEGRQEFGK